MADAQIASIPGAFFDRASRYHGALLVLAGASLWGCLGAFFRAADGMGKPSAAAQAFVVFVAMAVVSAPFAARAATSVRFDLGVWGRLMMLGACEAGSFLSYAAAMQKTTLAVASLTHYVAPVLVCMAAPWILDERVSRRAKIALPVCLAGLVLLCAPWRGGEAAQWTRGGDAAGAILGLLSAVFFAANLMLTKGLAKHVPPPCIVAFPKPFALLVLALFLDDRALAMAPSAYVVLAVGGIVAGAFACALFYAGIAKVTATNASLLCLVEPIVATAIGALMFGEGLRGSAALGAVLVVGGAAIAVTRDRSRVA